MTSLPTNKWAICAGAVAYALVAAAVPAYVFCRRSARCVLEIKTLRKKVSNFFSRYSYSGGTNISQLPKDLGSWRNPPRNSDLSEPAAETIWLSLEEFFLQKGYTLWKHDFWGRTVAPPTTPVPTGYMYSMHHHGFTGRKIGNAESLLEYQYLVSGIITKL